jgi:hypothetical protein
VQPTGTGSTRPGGTGAPAWGALIAALINGLLLVIGPDYLASLIHLLSAMSLNAIAAGFTTPNRSGFAATVLTLTGPHVFIHSSPPRGGIALGFLCGSVRLPFQRSEFGELVVTLATGFYLIAMGFVCTYPHYWLLVQFGASARRLLRRFLRNQHPPN